MRVPSTASMPRSNKKARDRDESRPRALLIVAIGDGVSGRDAGLRPMRKTINC